MSRDTDKPEKSSDRARRYIFYLEDSPGFQIDHFRMLSEQYELEVGAKREEVEVSRVRPFDLVIVDIMVHRTDDPDPESEQRNLEYEGIDWTRTGLEFIRRIRQGEYEQFGFLREVPILVVTAVTDAEVKIELLKKWSVAGYLGKPSTLDKLDLAVSGILE